MKILSQLRLSAGSLAIGLAMAAAPAMAQDVDDEDVIVSEEDEEDFVSQGVVTVTGSRIVRPETEVAPLSSPASIRKQSISAPSTTWSRL